MREFPPKFPKLVIDINILQKKGMQYISTDSVRVYNKLMMILIVIVYHLLIFSNATIYLLLVLH